VRDYTQMNQLRDKFSGRGFDVVGFPCNQFGHQENSSNAEILNVLKHVRPGGGFEPNFELTEKIEVNGAKTDPLWSLLKTALPAPYDDTPLEGARAGSNASEFIMANAGAVTWAPIRRSDVAWNFEKFLIDGDGVPFRRYSRFFETIKIEEDIESLLSGGPAKKQKV